MLAIFRLYMRNLSISYINLCGEFTVCGVGWVRISFCVGERGVDCGCLGNCVKVTSMSTYNYVYKWVIFWYVQCYIGNYIISGLSLKCYGIVYTVLHIWVLLFTISTASLYLMCWVLCTLPFICNHLLKGTEKTMCIALEWVAGCWQLYCRKEWSQRSSIISR